MVKWCRIASITFHHSRKCITFCFVNDFLHHSVVLPKCSCALLCFAFSSCPLPSLPLQILRVRLMGSLPYRQVGSHPITQTKMLHCLLLVTPLLPGSWLAWKVISLWKIATTSFAFSNSGWTRFLLPLALVEDPEWFHWSHLSPFQIYTTVTELCFCCLC